MLNFNGRVAIVTGAGQGMGASHAIMLASKGAKVVVNDINEENANKVVQEIKNKGGIAVVDKNDVSNDAEKIVKTAIDTYGQLDIVIANAGILKVGLFGEQSLDEFWNVFDVSFKGTVNLLHTGWKYLKESDSARVILVSSSGMLANPGASAYGAAKAAIFGLGNTLAMEGDRLGIQVSTVMPTAWTPMTESAYSNPVIVSTLRDQMGPEYVSSFITFLSHQDTKLHGSLYQIGGNHASAMVLGGMPKVFTEDNTPESWVKHEAELAEISENLDQFRVTGDQFAAEMIASNPAVADALKDINAADLGA